MRGFAASILVALLAGCSSAPAIGPGATAAIDQPGWADDISKSLTEATTDLERKILQDGSITAEELAAAEDAFVECASEAGFQVTDFRSGGGYSMDGPFTVDGPPSIRACQATFDRTSGRYWMMLRNPEGIDESALMISCLVRSGLVDEPFSRDEYLAGLGSSPLNVSTPEFSKCDADPSHAFQ